MKKLFRGLVIALVLLFTWPFFLYKKYGNVGYKLTGNTVIISNHYATLDAFFIYLTFSKKKIVFVTITSAKKKLISRFITWLFDCIYIDYEKSNISFFRQCTQILKEGGVVCIFPEGVINPFKYGLFPFESGFVYIAQKTGAKILPLFVYPRYEMFKKSVVYIGEEITKEEYSAFETRSAAALDIQLRVSDYSLELMEKGIIKSPDIDQFKQ